MKTKLNLLLFSVFALFFVTGCDNDDDHYLPDTMILDAFERMYPNATQVEWERKLGYFVADCKIDNKEKDVWFDANGEWMLTETDITLNELPKAVTDAIASSQYANWKIDDISYLERKDMEAVYVVEVEKAKDEVDLYYSEEGQLLKAVSDGGNSHQAVPTPVNEKIMAIVNEKYPDSKIVEIDVEPNYIEVDLLRGNLYFEMILDKNYKWIQTVYEASWVRVPDAVKTALANDGYTFNTFEDEAEMIIRPEGNSEVIIYRIELDREPEDLVLYYSEDGIRINN